LLSTAACTQRGGGSGTGGDDESTGGGDAATAGGTEAGESDGDGSTDDGPRLDFPWQGPGDLGSLPCWDYDLSVWHVSDTSVTIVPLDIDTLPGDGTSGALGEPGDRTPLVVGDFDGDGATDAWLGAAGHQVVWGPLTHGAQVTQLGSDVPRVSDATPFEVDGSPGVEMVVMELGQDGEPLGPRVIDFDNRVASIVPGLQPNSHYEAATMAIVDGEVTAIRRPRLPSDTEPATMLRWTIDPAFVVGTAVTESVGVGAGESVVALRGDLAETGVWAAIDVDATEVDAMGPGSPFFAHYLTTPDTTTIVSLPESQWGGAGGEGFFELGANLYYVSRFAPLDPPNTHTWKALSFAGDTVSVLETAVADGVELCVGPYEVAEIDGDGELDLFAHCGFSFAIWPSNPSGGLSSLKSTWRSPNYALPPGAAVPDESLSQADEALFDLDADGQYEVLVLEVRYHDDAQACD